MTTIVFTDCHLNAKSQDLSEADAAAAEVSEGLQARNIRDVRAFLNLADFLAVLLPKAGAALFGPWAYLYTAELAALASRHPLLSGIYKLLGTTLHLSDECGVFNDTSDAQVCHLSTVLICRCNWFTFTCGDDPCSWLLSAAG